MRGIALENAPFGAREAYRQLSSLHVSQEARGRGIGKELFAQMARQAQAQEINRKLADLEPCDCQLEYNVNVSHLDTKGQNP